MAPLVNKLGIFVAATLVALAIFGLLFRAALSWLIPVAPGDAVSGADLIEAIIFFGIFALAAATMVIGVLLLLVNRWRAPHLAVKLLVVSLVAPPAYFVLRSLLASVLD